MFLRQAARRSQTIATLLILLATLGLRVIYLVEIAGIGFFRRPFSDGRIFWQRAGQIAAGDWLGPADFVHAPLYAHVLGLVRMIGGDSLLLPRCVQLGFGALSCLLVMAACRRFFDGRAAVVAGLLLAIYPPVIFVDGLIQKTSLVMLLSAALLWLLAVCRDRPTGWRWLATGVVLGLLALTQQYALALALLAAAWLVLAPRAPSEPTARKATAKARLAWAGAFCLGVSLALTPWALRNRVVTGEFVLTTPNLGQNFAMGNHPRATGTYLPFKRGRSNAEHEQREWVAAAEKARGRKLSAQEVSDYYLHAGLDYVKSEPLHWLRLTARKIGLVWNAYEAPDTEDYYLYLEHSAVLRLLDRVFHFGVLCPIAVAGLVLTWRRFRETWVLHGWLLVVTAAVAVFVVFARYRLPLTPVLVMFAGAGIVELVRLTRARPGPQSGRSVIIMTLVVLFAAVLSNWPLGFERRPYSFAYTNHAVALADQRRFEEALNELDKAFAIASGDVDALLVKGSVLVDLGRHDEAIAAYQQAQRGDSSFGGGYRGLGDALLGLGRFAEAAEQYRRALALDSTDHIALCGLATATARQGLVAQAVTLFQQVMTMAPDYAEAWLNLGNTYLSVGRTDEAESMYQQALLKRGDYVDALYNLGVLEAQRGRFDTAMSYFEQVLKLRPDHGNAAAAMEAARQATLSR